jgi:hypothetical protein
MAEGTGRGEMLSIWFFVGALMLIYGLVLMPYGAWEWLGNHEANTVLHNLHPTFWWGLGMTLSEPSIPSNSNQKKKISKRRNAGNRRFDGQANDNGHHGGQSRILSQPPRHKRKAGDGCGA